MWTQNDVLGVLLFTFLLYTESAGLEFTRREFELELAFYECEVRIEQAACLIAAETLDERSLFAGEQFLDVVEREFLAQKNLRERDATRFFFHVAFGDVACERFVNVGAVYRRLADNFTEFDFFGLFVKDKFNPLMMRTAENSAPFLLRKPVNGPILRLVKSSTISLSVRCLPPIILRMTMPSSVV